MSYLDDPVPSDADPLDVRNRLATATLAMCLVVVGGSVGYYLIGGGKWPLIDCIFMTVITLTTVGYGETVPVSNDPSAMLFTLVLLFCGMGVLLYFVSSLTAFIIDGELHYYIRRKRMHKKIAQMEGHHIVCGLRGPGEYVVRELDITRVPMVVIDTKPALIDAIQNQLGHEIPYIVGDATDDAILLRAGINRSKAIIITLGDDRDNIFCTLAARTLNPSLKIITQGRDPTAEQKFRRAGADKVIYTSVVGGQRMANEVLRPNVTTFLDVMLRDTSKQLRVEEILINPESPIQDRALKDANLRRDTDVLVLAIYDPNTQQHIYNPTPNFILRAGHILIVLGEHREVQYLRRNVV